MARTSCQTLDQTQIKEKVAQDGIRGDFIPLVDRIIEEFWKPLLSLQKSSLSANDLSLSVKDISRYLTKK